MSDIIARGLAQKALTTQADMSQKVTPNLTKKHRILMVEIPRTTAEYIIPLPEDAFLGGAMVEVCGYDSFVENADEWKNEFDIFVLNTPNQISYQCRVTPTQVKAAVQKFMDAGVFLIWFKPENDLNFHKYGANGSIDAAQDADMSTLLSGLSRASKDLSAGTGTFQHNADYPFGSDELIRTVGGVACTPTNQYLSHFTSTDTATVFPVIAVQGATTANCTAYKPGKFFIIGHGGYNGALIDNKAYYKYIDGSVLLKVILGKTNNVRIAQDSMFGRRVAAIGIDCDITDEIDAIKYTADSFAGKPVGFGLVAVKVTDTVAGWLRTILQRMGMCSHTYDHFNVVNKVTVTAEAQTVGADQLVRLNRPFRAAISSVKTSDDVTTFSKNGTTINTANPGANEYAINEDTNYNTYSVDGVIKFHASRIGASVKITYTCDDEYAQNLGSIETLKGKGCLTSRCIYQTGGFYSAHPTTYALAEALETVMCAYSTYPGYNTAWQIAKGRGKAPIPVGIIAKPWYNATFEDVAWLAYSKADCENNLVPAVIARCAAMELPLLFYMHDFPFSATDANSIWVSATYNADWKKGTLALTRDYYKDFLQWMVTQFDAISAYWMTRGEYVDRLVYINKYLKYDVKEETGKTTITIMNTGKKLLNGATFRIPTTGTPTGVKQGNTKDCDYSYASNLVTAWCDLEPGKSETITVTF